LGFITAAVLALLYGLKKTLLIERKLLHLEEKILKMEEKLLKQLERENKK